MNVFFRVARRVRDTLFSRNSQSPFDDELEFHLQMQTDDNIRAGMSPKDARRAAVLKFGGIDGIKESYRDQRGLPWLETLIADLRYAIRSFKKSPGFPLAALSVLTVGIGATAAIVSVVNAVLLKTLPVAEPDRVVMLSTQRLLDGGEIDQYVPTSPAKFNHL